MRRLEVTFKRDAAARLMRLAKNRRIADVIREALALEEVFQNALTDGSKLIVRTQNNEELEVVRD